MAAYIKFDGVDGEAKDKDHDAWSDLGDFTQAYTQPGSGATGSTRRRGDVIVDDIHCTKELDKATPKLAEAVCSGKIFPTVTIHLTGSTTDAGRVTYYEIILYNVMITHHVISGSGQSEDVPTEQFSLNAEEINTVYTEVDSTGSEVGKVEYTWKVEEGTA